jgi:hypothetical protein
MPYEIGHAPKGSRAVSQTVMPTALQALETVEALRANDEEIRYIKTLDGHEIGIGELRSVAEQEGDARA